MRSSELSPKQRERDLERLGSERLDVLVIGGGVTGAGAALDAASRGLKVGLVEQRDYASGTSSRSSKLFHGGLRYLEQFDFGLVREALAERNLMLETLCPHLAKPVSFLYPLKHRIWERFYVGAGVLLYDLMARASGSPLPRHRHLSKKQMATVAPSIDGNAYVGGVQYWDARVDDARHTMTLARTAASHGALMSPSTRVVEISSDATGWVEVGAVDLEDGGHLTVQTKSVINATGVWSDDIQELAGSNPFDVEASKGIHLVVPRGAVGSDTGIIIRTKASVLFVIPWGDHWIVGTTDTPWSLRRAHPAASKTDIEYLLTWVNSVLSRPITEDQVVGVYAGLRPLLAGESEQTSKLSREHAVTDDGKGVISVAGGKYTTYRVMAKDAVDATTRYLSDSVPESKTESLPLIGADMSAWDSGQSPPEAVDSDIHERLLGRYGGNVSDLYEMIEEEPAMAERVDTEAPYLAAELLYAATHEGALHLDDFLTRRTRLSIETRSRGIDAAKPVTDLVASSLGWSESDKTREIEHYTARVDAELDSQRQPDDRTADAARMGAPDVRTGGAE